MTGQFQPSSPGDAVALAAAPGSCALSAANQPQKALILSPLLNLPHGPPSSLTIVQHVMLRPSRGGDSPGVATLSLAPDGRSLTVTVDDRDGNQSVGVELRRLGLRAAAASPADDANLRVIEVTRCAVRGTARPYRKEIRFDRCAFLSAGDHGPLPVVAVEALRPDAILGLPTPAPPTACASQPAAGLPAGRQPHSRSYLERRLADELAAAVGARLAVATARHVELATLYARALRTLGALPSQG